MVFVYALFSLKDHKFYIGLTNNVRRRTREHISGKNPSTSSRRPLELVYYEGHLSKQDAARRERYFKSTKGRSTLRQMLRDSLQELTT